MNKGQEGFAFMDEVVKHGGWFVGGCLVCRCCFF